MARTYRNPVYPGYFADPFVVPTPEGYVAVGTGRVVDGRVFEVLRSPDLVHWEHAGGALDPLPDALTDELGDTFWAPEMAYLEGRWWMYYSVGREDVGHSLRVAVADDAAGPYKDCGVDLTPDERFAIDPHPFQDDDGTWYLYYARDVLEGPRVGTMLAVDVLESPTRLAGRPTAVLAPTADWQIFRRQRRDVRAGLRLAHPRGTVRLPPAGPVRALLLRGELGGADVRGLVGRRGPPAGPVAASSRAPSRCCAPCRSTSSAPATTPWWWARTARTSSSTTRGTRPGRPGGCASTPCAGRRQARCWTARRGSTSDLQRVPPSPVA